MEIKNSSRICEIIQSYDEFKERIAKELTELSRKMIAEKNMSSIITEIEVRPMYSEETPFRIFYTLNFDGLSIAERMGIKGDEDLNENIEIIIKNTQYDLKLIDEYPDEFKLWSFMHTHESIRETDKFCDLHIWPNTTTTSFGGGDYHVKRIKSVYAPRYLERLNESIASYADILSRMLNYKKDFEKLVKEMEANNDKRND